MTTVLYEYGQPLRAHFTPQGSHEHSKNQRYLISLCKDVATGGEKSRASESLQLS